MHAALGTVPGGAQAKAALQLYAHNELYEYEVPCKPQLQACSRHVRYLISLPPYLLACTQGTQGLALKALTGVGIMAAMAVQEGRSGRSTAVIIAVTCLSAWGFTDFATYPCGFMHDAPIGT